MSRPLDSLMRHADPVDLHDLPPITGAHDDGLYQAILARRDQIRTADSPPQRARTGNASTRRNLRAGLVVATVTFVAILLAIGAAALVFDTRTDGDVVTVPPTTVRATTSIPTTTELPPTTLVSTAPDETFLTPREVGEALDRAALGGDLMAIRALYSSGATLSFNDWIGSFDTLWTHHFADWDGDFFSSSWDVMLWERAADYVAGVTRAFTCVESDGSRLVCDTLFENHIFISGEQHLDVTVEYTIDSGLITHQRITGSDQADYEEYLKAKIDQEVVAEYVAWAEANRPEMADAFHGFAFTLNGLDPENLETHRELVAEWVAQR